MRANGFNFFWNKDVTMLKDYQKFTDNFNANLAKLSFSAPVAYVYNPLDYAKNGWLAYCEKYGMPPKRIMFIGMNPGPWGMAQTGVPFGAVKQVKGWLGLHMEVGKPPVEHPKRPVTGLACTRNEVSGTRVWGWAEQRYDTPENFFKDFFVHNYCPLIFYTEEAKNITPDKIKPSERGPLLEVCDESLRWLALIIKPQYAIGVGKFAADRAKIALAGMDIKTFGIMHPSPANPKANSGWARIIEDEMREAGLAL